jgi:hypothetical protein
MTGAAAEAAVDDDEDDEAVSSFFTDAEDDGRVGVGRANDPSRMASYSRGVGLILPGTVHMSDMERRRLISALKT